ncbi:hypothetical protein B0H67DRAFT_563048 [Lasiosphaeris hirsuta]|uniref:Uncharacterized protein n=1 Tax=Lasiosphaeris hirsuta TaxID=260670 RepID=A0AA40BAR2_9PEZI|nr:hypothetical protein B0H67DRAFT_563048 [Lasiosphaeris hirsuta]
MIPPTASLPPVGQIYPHKPRRCHVYRLLGSLPGADLKPPESHSVPPGVDRAVTSVLSADVHLGLDFAHGSGLQIQISPYLGRRLDAGQVFRPVSPISRPAGCQSIRFRSHLHV